MQFAYGEVGDADRTGAAAPQVMDSGIQGGPVVLVRERDFRGLVVPQMENHKSQLSGNCEFLSSVEL